MRFFSDYTKSSSSTRRENDWNRGAEKISISIQRYVISIRWEIEAFINEWYFLISGLDDSQLVILYEFYILYFRYDVCLIGDMFDVFTRNLNIKWANDTICDVWNCSGRLPKLRTHFAQHSRFIIFIQFPSLLFPSSTSACITLSHVDRLSYYREARGKVQAFDSPPTHVSPRNSNLIHKSIQFIEQFH